jgi:CheY-like chemotaxis protein
VRCDIVLAPDLWHVDIDEGQISQVINNLLINACQAMPDGGVIRISSQNETLGINERPPLKEGRYVRISVKDHGIGIPGEHLPKIFDPYFTTKQKGNGLGLATSYAIIKKHEGSILVESKLGVGATFHIYLPASRNKNARQIGPEVKTQKGEGRILVMDDVEAVREVATNMLRSLGYTTADARDGVEALELYRESMETGKPFDAVILDLTVPGGMGGQETVRNLLRMDPKAKVIVSSGYSNDGIMAEYKVHGFSDVVPKPYNLTQLGDAVGRLLSKLC